ncbi:hypothetical protein BJV77DRAFT_382486 [Russula vinacea]|nr:hypothetical protein BJV77DRAFT_382486 [Russula vinacea]
MGPPLCPATLKNFAAAPLRLRARKPCFRLRFLWDGWYSIPRDWWRECTTTGENMGAWRRKAEAWNEVALGVGRGGEWRKGRQASSAIEGSFVGEPHQ